ncbi:hypothetical protein E3U55_16915 [Filobacillus milosensis]|uniref:DUF7674 domain-containing protein n=1 Tax=Filobacillus milosensis TaxID=94137 RepID=A0A4Y8IAU2_9BACI|nr:hypothetical protein [Filobacillus milosensis]TFB12912.1 hypothetical protein E3U55_16915 [Filobacillus milosensis]
MNRDYFAELFVNEFPGFKPLLEKHIQFNDELLPHVFFGECNDYFIKYLETEKTKELEKLFDFFERMATGDEYVKELLTVTILERLGDNEEILNTAYKYMGKETRKASDEIEKFWGRC